MSFKDKIDKILEVNTLGINSVSALEDKIEAGRGAVNEFYKEDREPGRKTLKKIMSLPGLNIDWYTKGIGPVFTINSLQNSTYVEVLTKEKDPAEENRILTRNIDRMGEVNEFLLRELKRYKEKFGDI